MTSPEMVYCAQCQRRVSFHVDRVNHGQQLLLTLLTVGIWLPVWLTMVFRPARLCDECGNPIWRD